MDSLRDASAEATDLLAPLLAPSKWLQTRVPMDIKPFDTFAAPVMHTTLEHGTRFDVLKRARVCQRRGTYGRSVIAPWRLRIPDRATLSGVVGKVSTEGGILVERCL